MMLTPTYGAPTGGSTSRVWVTVVQRSSTWRPTSCVWPCRIKTSSVSKMASSHGVTRKQRPTPGKDARCRPVSFSASFSGMSCQKDLSRCGISAFCRPKSAAYLKLSKNGSACGSPSKNQTSRERLSCAVRPTAASCSLLPSCQKTADHPVRR